MLCNVCLGGGRWGHDKGGMHDTGGMKMNAPTSMPTEEPIERSMTLCCECTEAFNDDTRGSEACPDKDCLDLICSVDPACAVWEWDADCADAAECVCNGMDYDCKDNV